MCDEAKCTCRICLWCCIYWFWAVGISGSFAVDRELCATRCIRLIAGAEKCYLTTGGFAC